MSPKKSAETNIDRELTSKEVINGVLGSTLERMIQYELSRINKDRGSIEKVLKNDEVATQN